MEDDAGETHHDGLPSFEIEDRDAALIGTDVGGYVIECELGRGGMGVVFAATHPVIGKRAAIKVLKPSLSNNPATVERFKQEARSVNQIGHPNIVDIFAFGALPDGRSYLVMDLLEGESLRKRVKRGALSLPEAVLVLDEVASALAAAHGKGFIHRDLKPDNVFLVAHPSRTDVKLLDFGLAKLSSGATNTAARAYRTATGAQLGTPDYMSPEQLRGSGGVDHRTDIYALGVVAFEVLTGKRPRRYGDGTFDLDGVSIARALQMLAAVPSELADLVETLLASDAEQRPSLATVRATLKRVRPSLAAIAPMRTSGLADANASGTERSVGALVGARPVLPTPPSGASTVVERRPPSRPPPISQAQAQVSAFDRRPTQPPVPVPHAFDGEHASFDARPASSSPSLRPSYQPGAAGLQPKGIHASTKLGVAPAPARPSGPHPLEAARRTSESRIWLVLGLVLVIASAAALVVVLAT
ncbi:MAG: serine/threonine protein kinase [Kofleriaceae bacterium]|nr:serine/threonine protein kinase [Kofleriaceae bacterium]